MTRVVHLVVGPDEHGVVLHGERIARTCGHDLVRVPDAATAVDLGGVDVVHVPFTDRLFAPTCEDAVRALQRIAAQVGSAGAALSVTLHDVPQGDDAWSTRRRAAYRAVVALARGVVVNSLVELALVQDDADGVHSLRRIDLPVERVGPTPRPEPDPATDVTVLGFVFPDRGYEQVLRALPSDGRLVALGRAAAGHEHLPAELGALAADLGVGWRTTGFVPDDALGERLRAAAVPIAPNPRTTASGSIGSWLAHGRRPLVPDCAYTRELAGRMPGALTLYTPATLPDALVRAREEPATTWLAADIRIGPSWDEAAAQYRSHLQACAPPRPGATPVPGNRWDLVRPSSDAPLVSVVIPYYDAQPALDLLLAALRVQTVADRIEVIVVDDGSPRPPEVDPATVRVLRQPRRGFGAARARNLGASVARGDVLAFLDGDMVPAPDYLERLVRLPTDHRDGLAVGRRRHADLTGWGEDGVVAWLAGTGPAPELLAEPAWLTDAYARSADLLHADARSYRYVISAVLALHRSLFERLGGFDERFDHYGGEDWELAHRAWLAGALFAHVPDAVAWHDGGDWAVRHETPDAARAAKNREVLTLARLLPDPDARGGGQWRPYVHTVVRMSGDDPAAVLLTARSAFASGADCGFWLDGPDSVTTAELLDDPRIRAGEPAPDVLARAAVQLQVSAPCDLSSLPALCRLASRLGVVTTPSGTLVSTRAAARAGSDELRAELFGRHDRSGPVPVDVDLDRDLPRVGQPVRRS